jgi:hypothetical protein
VSVALNKVEGIESVNVRLKRGVAHIGLTAGNSVSLPQLRRIVKAAGYATGDAVVTARGTVTRRNGRLALDVTGTSTSLALAPDPSASDTLEALEKALAGSGQIQVEAAGTVATPKTAQAADILRLRSFTIDP